MTELFGGFVGLFDDLLKLPKTLSDIESTQRKHTTMLNQLLEGINTVANQQDDLNTLVGEESAAVSAIADSLTGIHGDLTEVLQELQDAQANNQPLDFSGLQAVVDSLGTVAAQAASIDAERPNAPTPPSA